MIVGAIIVLFVPEDLFGNQVLFRLSDQHGPSTIDTVGLLLVISGWLYYIYALWQNRRKFCYKNKLKQRYS